MLKYALDIAQRKRKLREAIATQDFWFLTGVYAYLQRVKKVIWNCLGDAPIEVINYRLYKG